MDASWQSYYLTESALCISGWCEAQDTQSACTMWRVEFPILVATLSMAIDPVQFVMAVKTGWGSKHLSPCSEVSNLPPGQINGCLQCHLLWFFFPCCLFVLYRELNSRPHVFHTDASQLSYIPSPHNAIYQEHNPIPYTTAFWIESLYFSSQFIHWYSCILLIM